MEVDYAKTNDFGAWIALAREVEPLFGPMADEPGFREGLIMAISENAAFCLRSGTDEKNKVLMGGIVVSKQENEIAWLAVAKQYRKMGYGRKLLEFAISKMNPQENIFVQTFAETVSAGEAARKLYLDFGFTDHKNAGLNPAGVPTVMMRLKRPQSVSA